MKYFNKEKLIKTTIQIGFWFIIWTIIAKLIDSPVIMPSPLAVLKSSLLLLSDGFFWTITLHTSIKIIIGLIFGIIIGIFLILFGYNCKIVRWIIDPLINFIKTTPVAALIVVLLIWVGSDKIAINLVMAVVVPNIYLTILEDLRTYDSKILELLKVYKVNSLYKTKYILIPQAIDSTQKSWAFVFGFAWKAGISGEIISQAKDTLGNQIYLSKVYLETDTLFAYVFLMIIITFILERLFIKLFGR